MAARFVVLWIGLACLGFAAGQPQGAANSPQSPAFPPTFAEESNGAQPIPVTPSAGGVMPIPSPSPMIPVLPNPSPPKLSGRCQLNFSDLTTSMDRTAQDCLAPLAIYVGEVICCPQLESLLYLAQGQYINSSGHLAFGHNEARHCFSDMMSLLVSKGANSTVSDICSLRYVNLTRGKCPIAHALDLQKLVNTTRLLTACRGVDPLKECCKPVCQPAIEEAAFQLTLNSSVGPLKPVLPSTTDEEVLDDCREVVLAWITSQLDKKEANTALRNLFSCKINQACPLVFSDATPVIETCRGPAPSNTTCCQSLHKYISKVQQQKLITNLQALECVSVLGSVLQKRGVTSNIYDLCGIYLKDFSLQGIGDQGCLLNSLPSDVMLTNSSGITFTCDLNDNIAAPWLAMTSSSLCLGSRPNASYPKIPQSVAPIRSGSAQEARDMSIRVAFVVAFALQMMGRWWH